MSNRDTFVKVFTDLDDHPAWVDLEPEHAGLWLLALLYCRRNLTDGHFPVKLLRRWSFGASAPAELVAAGRWHESGHDCAECPQPGDGQLYLHAYLEVQNSRSEYDEICAKRAEAGRKGGKERARRKQVAKQTTKQNPSQSKLEVDSRSRTKDSPSPADAGVPFDAFWLTYPRKVGKQAAAKAYAKAVKGTDADAIAAGLAAAVQVWRASGTEAQFIPHPSTWLNEGRWADEHGVKLPDPADLLPTIVQCRSEDPHPRHEQNDGRNRLVCMGVPA